MVAMDMEVPPDYFAKYLGLELSKNKRILLLLITLPSQRLLAFHLIMSQSSSFHMVYFPRYMVNFQGHHTYQNFLMYLCWLTGEVSMVEELDQGNR